MYRDETSTDSETSEELNEKVDLDTEQTQTFSVSESNFNQVSQTCIMQLNCMSVVWLLSIGPYLKKLLSSLPLDFAWFAN